MRDRRIDFIKGMLMWCVVYGHTLNALFVGIAHGSVWLHAFVRIFDMPFFMILSGYFLKKSLEKRRSLDVLCNRLSMILVPIVVWTLVLGKVDFVHRYYFLWAVLASGIIIIVIHKCVTLFPKALGGVLEFFAYLVIIGVLHLVKVPWNLFYLFPFFVVGYYVPEIPLPLKFKWSGVLFVLFVVGVCLWKPVYTPWNIGAFAWKDSLWAFVVYGYRFVLGVLGVNVMAKAFDLICRNFGEESIFVKTVSNWGQETLAIYIMQTLCIEIVTMRLCQIVHRHIAIGASQPVVNVIGYVIAPIVSFVAIVALYWVIRRIRRIYLLKYSFGFKVG